MRTLVLAIVLVSAVSGRALAWLRWGYEDAEIVARSELVVVGHLKPGSIHYVPHAVPPNEGASWEHHATLVITAALKGTVSTKEIPIIIHYGLDPLVEGKIENDHEMETLPGTFPKGSVQIVDTGGDGSSSRVPDATRDNLWFLRRLSSKDNGRSPGTGDLGIVDPEDLQPLALTAYFRLYLGPDPEAAVTAYAAKHPEPRMTRYVDHLAVQRIAKLPDAGERVDKLLPYFVRRTEWSFKEEAAAAIEAAGAAAAGPRLAAIFPTANHRTRDSIIGLWGRMRYAGAVDTLIGILRTNDQFWAKQQLAKGWWSTAQDSPLTLERQDRYSQVYESVTALGSIADPRAKAALEQTLARWHAIHFENPQIVEATQAALLAITTH